MRVLKYIPQITCSAMLLLGTLATTPVLAQPTTISTFTVTLSAGAATGNPGMIDFGTTGYFQIRVAVAAGSGDAHNVVLNGFFTPGNSSPPASLSGFGSGANGRNCVSPDPLTPGNPNSFKCTIGEVINGTTAVANLPNSDANLQRRIVISQPAPPSRPDNCPLPEHAGDLTVTVSAQNAPPRTQTRIGHDTEDFADVGVAISGTPDNAKVGDTVTSTVTITNFGPCAAEHLCAVNNNSAGLMWQSNTGACTKPYGPCNGIVIQFNPNLPPYDATKECGFPQSTTPVPPPDNLPGYLPKGASFTIVSTYVVDFLPGSLTNEGDTNEVDIGSDTNLINYEGHSQAAVTQTVVKNEASCSVAGTGASSIAVVGLLLCVAHAFNRRRRS